MKLFNSDTQRQTTLLHSLLPSGEKQMHANIKMINLKRNKIAQLEIAYQKHIAHSPSHAALIREDIALLEAQIDEIESRSYPLFI